MKTHRVDTKTTKCVFLRILTVYTLTLIKTNEIMAYYSHLPIYNTAFDLHKNLSLDMNLTSCSTICYTMGMRTTLNISMPPLQKKNVDRMIKEYKYTSVSEFFRDAVRALEDDKLVADILESEKEFATGKGKKLHSLKDLI